MPKSQKLGQIIHSKIVRFCCFNSYSFIWIQNFHSYIIWYKIRQTIPRLYANNLNKYNYQNKSLIFTLVPGFFPLLNQFKHDKSSGVASRAASESRENESHPEASSHGYWIHKLDTRKTARVNFTYVWPTLLRKLNHKYETFCANIMNISCFSHHINLRMCWWKFTIAITLALYIATLPMLQSMLLHSFIQCLHQTFDSAGTKCIMRCALQCSLDV